MKNTPWSNWRTVREMTRHTNFRLTGNFKNATELAFPLANLRPGEYECEVNVLDPGGQKAAFWRAPVMVIP
jgi:hypothetical protein